MTTNKDRAVEVMRNFWHGGRYAVGFDEIADALADAGLLTPDPQPRTLEDMTPEERRDCQWMQARDDVGNRVVITKMNEGDQEVTVLYENGGLYEWPYSVIVPLPDLRGMVWPEDTPKESSTLPSPEVVPAREPWIVEYCGERYVGVRDPYESPHWAMAQMDGTDVYFADDFAVTLVSRLVPEVKA